jgi:transcriptional regulator with PAS, ATPase and Fis domain
MPRHIHTRLRYAAPLVFAFLSLLAAVVAYRITGWAIAGRVDPAWPVALWSLLVCGLTFGVGLLIFLRLLAPMERFVREAERLPAVRIRMAEKPASRDELARYAEIFAQLTDFLGEVEAREAFPGMVAHSKIMRGILHQVLKVAETDATVLIAGESGTGKGVLARSIHAHSPRRSRPLVSINCAAIPEPLLESELFGHEKGAFTGAVGRKLGKLEAAHTGTVFLDEIGDLSPALQGKLLRVLEDKVMERVGGTEEVRVDVRFIAATNKNLAHMVEDKQFRQDLYYRLNVLSISLPPLRDRKEDLAPLVAEILARKGASVRVGEAAMALLLAHSWPGNVRELANVLERALVLCGGEDIEPRHLLLGQGQDGEVGPPAENVPPGQNLDQFMEDVERRAILAALTRSGGVQAKAARLLGIKPRSLWHRVKKYGLAASAGRRDKL